MDSGYFEMRRSLREARGESRCPALQDSIKRFIEAREDYPIHSCVLCKVLEFMCNLSMCTTQVRNRISTYLNANIPEGSYICRRCCESVRKTEKTAAGQGETSSHHSLPKYFGYTLNSIPECVSSLNTLEERLVSPRLPFMSVMTVGVTQQKKLKGGVLNVPINTVHFVRDLPRQPSDCHVILIKLKRQLAAENDYMTSYVRPNAIKAALMHLCSQSLFQACGVQYVPNNAERITTESFVDLAHDAQRINGLDQNDPFDNTDGAFEGTNTVEENVGNMESMLMQELQYQAGETVSVSYAPGEGRKPASILNDLEVETLSFPTLFGGKNRTYHEDMVRKKVTYRDVVKYELMHRDRRFAQHSGNIFFKLFYCQLMDLSSIVSLRIRQHRVREISHLKAGDLCSIQGRQALENSSPFFNELKVMKGSYQYLQHCRRNVFAMVRQLGRPSFFMTLSMADTKWTGLHEALQYLQGKSGMPLYFQNIVELLHHDPITCVRYYVHRRDALFNTILKSETGVLGHVEDFYFLDEFQHRGSPHTHILLWCRNTPDLVSGSENEVSSWMDAHISCDGSLLPQQLLQSQTHRHTFTCKRKQGGTLACRFGFPKFPMKTSQILSPLKNSKREYDDNLKKIKDFLTHHKSDMSFLEMLAHLNMSYEAYILAIRSGLKRRSVFIKRDLKDRWVNSFNPIISNLWHANMDLQPCLDSYSVANYIVSYMTKVNKGMTKTMREVAQESLSGTKSLKHSLRLLGNAFVNGQEVSLQEASYILLGLQMTKSSRVFEFINTSRPSDRVQVVKPISELEQLSPESMDIFAPNAVMAKYTARPVNMENVCLADFCADYSVQGKSSHYKVRKIPKIIRFVGYSKSKNELEYMREQLLLFVPFRSELEFSSTSYHYHLHINMIEQRRSKYVKIVSQELDEAIMREEEEDEIDNDHTPVERIDITREIPLLRESTRMECRIHAPVAVQEDTFFAEMRALNVKQWGFVNYVMHEVRNAQDPIKIFLSGGAGVGKSTLIHAMHDSLIRYYNSRRNVDITRVRVLKVAPTGAAAFNIGGTTIHNAFRIPVHNQSVFYKLKGESLSKYKESLIDLEFVIIDEVSMMDSLQFLWVDYRLQQLKSNELPFGGIHVLLVGDLFQLRPVGSYVFEAFPLVKRVQNHLWPLFRFFELTEIMRQKDDLEFAQCLNRVREGLHTEQDVSLLLSRNNVVSHRHDCKNIDFTNREVNAHNNYMYEAAVSEKYSVLAHDLHSFEKNANRLSCPSPLIKDKPTNATRGLEHELRVYVGAVVQCVLNLDVSDGLTNGATGEVMSFSTENEMVKVIWVLFDKEEVGAKWRSTSQHLREIYNVSNLAWTPVEKVDLDFTFRKDSPDCISRLQFPLRLAAATTCHRSQGLTYDEGIVHFRGRKFHHYAYVALSRFRKLEKLFITNFDASWISVDPQVKRQMEILRSPQRSIILPTIYTNDTIPPFIFQNVRTLRKYFKDIEVLARVTNASLIVLVETHLTSVISDSNFLLPGYSLLRYDSRRSGVVIFSKFSFSSPFFESCRFFDLFHGQMLHPRFGIIFLIALYRPPHQPYDSLVSKISDLLLWNGNLILMGDFNLLFESLPSNFKDIFLSKRLTQYVCGPSHIQGNTIDHIWSNMSFKQVQTLDSYFSDHYPIMMQLPGNVVYNLCRKKCNVFSNVYHSYPFFRSWISQETFAHQPQQQVLPSSFIMSSVSSSFIFHLNVLFLSLFCWHKLFTRIALQIPSPHQCMRYGYFSFSCTSLSSSLIRHTEWLMHQIVFTLEIQGEDTKGCRKWTLHSLYILLNNRRWSRHNRGLSHALSSLPL